MTSVNDLLVKMIKEIDLFKDFSDDDILDLANSFVLKYYPSWSLIIREWEKPNSIYILKNWILEAKKSHWLSSIHLWDINPWEIFWEMSYIKWGNSMASVTSKEDSDVWQISVEDFDRFIKSNPGLMDSIYETMKKREEMNSSSSFNKVSNNKQDDDIDDIKINI